MKLYKKDGTLIVETEHTTVKETVEYCAANRISLYDADLIGADLSGADLSGADLSGANLTGADLTRAVLIRTDLRWADLSGANIYKAELIASFIVQAKGIYIFNKTNGRTCYAVQHEKCLMIQAGCFWGSLDDFEQQCKKKYPNDPIAAYAPQIAYLRELSKILYQ